MKQNPHQRARKNACDDADESVPVKHAPDSITESWAYQQKNPLGASVWRPKGSKDKQ